MMLMEYSITILLMMMMIDYHLVRQLMNRSEYCLELLLVKELIHDLQFERLLLVLLLEVDILMVDVVKMEEEETGIECEFVMEK